jgi:hypothetical protein
MRRERNARHFPKAFAGEDASAGTEFPGPVPGKRVLGSYVSQT